jgi:hypothetical protein
MPYSRKQRYVMELKVSLSSPKRYFGNRVFIADKELIISDLMQNQHKGIGKGRADTNSWYKNLLSPEDCFNN